MLVAGFWIFSFIMYAMYTANLAASLTVSKLTATINSVRELSAQTDTKVRPLHPYLKNRGLFFNVFVTRFLGEDLRCTIALRTPFLILP